MNRKHLDLGCGSMPRNPYRCEELFGVDIRADVAENGVCQIAVANLITGVIPFDDNSFDSVSAYDFFEHIPRVAVNYSDKTSHFPFIELMNEIWRVLKPGGVLYAVTPAFPDEKAFRDPTHVNIITKKTHRYFTEPYLLGKMYGFKGGFKLIRQRWVYPRGDYEPTRGGIGRMLLRFCDILVMKRSHLIWEFSANKNEKQGSSIQNDGKDQ